MAFIGPLSRATELLNEIIRFSDTVEFRQSWLGNAETPVELQNLVFAADFHTEITMNGILGFLENSTGRYLEETVAAIRAMGATHTAATLAQIQQVMRKWNVSTASLRADLSSGHEYQVANFENPHPCVSPMLIKEILVTAEALDGGGQVAPDLGDRFEAYVEEHFDLFSKYMTGAKR